MSAYKKKTGMEHMRGELHVGYMLFFQKNFNLYVDLFLIFYRLFNTESDVLAWNELFEACKVGEVYCAVFVDVG